MNTTMADGASERLDAQIADALFGQPGMSKLDVANRLRQLRGSGEPLLCGSCYGLGVIGYTSGQTPEQFEQGEYQCPDCAHPSPAGQGELVQEALEYFERAGDAGDRKYVAAIRAALAARQPVGEPVGWGRTRVDGGFIAELLPGVADRVSNMAPLYLQPPAQAVDLGPGVKAIAAERERQMQAEGFTRDADQQYRRGELAWAATAYVQLAAMDLRDGGRNHIAWHGPAAVWPWAAEWWKPADARRDLERAGALIAAQIDLIDSTAVGNGQ